MKKIITSVVFLCLCASNVYALGDGINVNGLQINSTIGLAEKHDDNVTRAETNTVSSWVTVVNPAIDITSGSDINHMTLGYAFERGDYTTSKNDSYSDHVVTAETHNEYNSKTVFDTGLSYKKSHDARGSTFSGIVTGFNTPDKWHELAANAQFGYGGQSATGRVEIGGSYANKRYDNHRRLTVGRDIDTMGGTATFYYRVGAKTSALIEGSYTRYDYTLATSLLDSNEIIAYAGLTWEATARTTGTIKAGLQRKKFRRGTRAASKFFSYDVQIDWEPLTYSTWSLASSYKAIETDGTGSYIKSNDVNLDWTHHWSERFSHTANVSYLHDVYVGSTRKDNSITTGLSVDYQLTSWLDIGAGYNYAKRTSSAVNAAYKSNIYALTFNAAL